MSQGFFEVKAKANIGSIELNTLPSGDLVANLSLAATKKYKDNQGQPQEKPRGLAPQLIVAPLSC